MTRAVEQAGPFVEALRACGATPVLLPTIRVGPPDDLGPLNRAAADIANHDLVVLGSVNAARALAQALRQAQTRCQVPIACVGAKTLAALAGAEFREVLQGELLAPEVYRAEALVSEIQVYFGTKGGMTGLRVLHPRAPEGRRVVQERLRDFGADVHAVDAYRILAAPRARRESVAAAGHADVITFLSGQTLAYWMQVVPESVAQDILARSLVAVIGPVAAAKALQLNVRVDVMPAEATTEALICALQAHFYGASE